MCMIARQVKKPQYGFTLVELIVFIVVLAVGLVGVALVINRTMLVAPQAMEKTKAMELAQLYLDEILTKRFDENTGQGGLPTCDSPDPATSTNKCTLEPSFGIDGAETRSVFDDIDDYHGLNNAPPENASGTALTTYNGYSVAVNVTYAGDDFDDAGIPLDLHNNFAKLITVTITSPFNNAFTMSAYRLNY